MAPVAVEVAPGEVVEVHAAQDQSDVVLSVMSGEHPWEADWQRPPKAEVVWLVEPGTHEVTVSPAVAQDARQPLPALEVRRRPRVEADVKRAGLLHTLAEAAVRLQSSAPGAAASARPLLEEALALCLEGADGVCAAEVRIRLGELSFNAGLVDDAESQYRQAFEAFDAAGDVAGRLDARTHLGLVQNWRGNPAAALEHYHRALAEAESVGDRHGQALLRGNLGSTYVYLGENQKALDQFRGAIAVARVAGALRAEGWAQSNLARLWHALGDYERALEQAQQALTVMEKARDARGRLGVLLNTGVILTAMGRYDEAQAALARGDDLARAAGDVQARAALLGRLGEAHAGNGDVAAATAAFRSALALYEEQRARRAQGLTLASLGALQLRAGDAEAGSSLQRALELGRAAGDPTVEAAALKGLAALALRRGDRTAARRTSEQALAIVESVRLQVAAPDHRSSYFASVQDQYEQHIAILMEAHRAEPDRGLDEEAFHASERARARSLLDGLAAGRADIEAGVAPELRRREAEPKKAIERASAAYMKRLAANAREAEIADAEKAMSALLAQYQEHLADVRARSPRYAALTQPAPLTAREVRGRLLDGDTTLVQIALGEAASHAFVLDADTFRAVALPGRAVLEELARAAQEFASRRPAKSAAATRAVEDPLVRLGSALLPPLGDLRRRVVFVAQGALQAVPFAALRRAPGGDPLVAGHEIVALPSASTLAVLRQELAGRPAAGERVAILADPVFDPGDPRLPLRGGASTVSSAERAGTPRDLARFARLPFTRREAAAITRNAGTGVRSALGFDATRELAMSPELARFKVLHFATHGVLDDERPELSGLVLSLFDAQGRPRDGFVRLAEIYNLERPAELVVLSACRTAVGKSVRGEGLVGLGRAFMYAGAARVLASLWTVDDAATAELMGHFYRILFVEGRPAAEALRGAQRRMQQQPRWRHPYYWAAFTLQGEWK